MGNNYCRKMHPSFVVTRRASPIWKGVLSIRDDLNTFIWWQIKGGFSSFWFDNWTKCGALYFLEGDHALEEEIEVREFFDGQGCNDVLLKECLSEELVAQIINDVNPRGQEVGDKAWRMANSDGSFIVKSAYNLLRTKKGEVEWAKNVWIKGLPSKIAFYL